MKDLLRSGEAHGHGQQMGLERTLEPPTGCVDEEVEQNRVGSVGSGQQKAAPTETRERGLGYSRREPRGYGCVKGVATRAQNLAGGLAYPGVPGGNRGARQSTTSYPSNCGWPATVPFVEPAFA